MTEKLLEKIKELREASKKRNFSQSIDLIISLKEFDIKKSENKINETFVLPNTHKESEVVIFADGLKDSGCTVLTSSDTERLGKNKSAAKKLIGKTDFFLAEPKMMPMIGKLLGKLLAPRGLMPAVLGPGTPPNTLVNGLKKSIRIKIKDSPVIQCSVGNEKMPDEKISENIMAVLKFLETKLPKGEKNIGKILIKMTMGKPVKIEVR